jgi:2-polyprenyl-6-methoxyphenol hydroxylase-like FAD-dependent oxidoreductase
MRREDGHYRVELSEGGEVAARSVIAASGARSRRATGAVARSSGWPPRWGRALWRCGWSIST